VLLGNLHVHICLLAGNLLTPPDAVSGKSMPVTSGPFSGALSIAMSRRLLAGVLVAAAVLVAGIAATAVMRTQRGTASQAAVPDHGSANTFGGTAGFEVAVSDVHLPEAGGRVTVAVSFRNTSSSQQRADPQDFTFRDSSGATARPLFDATCPPWTQADLHPGGGAGQSPRDRNAQQVGPDFGPVPLCFAVARPPTAGPTLVWSPDVGLLGTPVLIPLR
jgi:hypothetical protein